MIINLSIGISSNGASWLTFTLGLLGVTLPLDWKPLKAGDNFWGSFFPYNLGIDLLFFIYKAPFRYLISAQNQFANNLLQSSPKIPITG